MSEDTNSGEKNGGFNVVIGGFGPMTYGSFKFGLWGSKINGKDHVALISSEDDFNAHAMLLSKEEALALLSDLPGLIAKMDVDECQGCLGRGWLVVTRDEDGGRLSVERCDSCKKFETDQAALDAFIRKNWEKQD